MKAKSVVLLWIGLIVVIVQSQSNNNQQGGGSPQWQWNSDKNQWEWHSWEWVPSGTPPATGGGGGSTGSNTPQVTQEIISPPPATAATPPPPPPLVTTDPGTNQPTTTTTTESWTNQQSQIAVPSQPSQVTTPNTGTSSSTPALRNPSSGSSSTTQPTTETTENTAENTVSTTTNPTGTDGGDGSGGGSAAAVPGFEGADNTKSGASAFIMIGIGAAAVVALMIMSVYYKQHRIRKAEELSKLDDPTPVAAGEPDHQHHESEAEYRLSIATPSVAAKAAPTASFPPAPAARTTSHHLKRSKNVRLPPVVEQQQPHPLATQCSFDARSSAGSVNEPTEAFQDFVEESSKTHVVPPVVQVPVERDDSSGSVNIDEVRESAMQEEQTEAANAWTRAASEMGPNEMAIFTESKWSVASPTATMTSSVNDQVNTDWAKEEQEVEAQHVSAWSDVEDLKSDDVSFSTASRYSTVVRKSDESDYSSSGRSRGASIAYDTGPARASYTAVDLTASSSSAAPSSSSFTARASYSATDIIAMARHRSRRDSDEYSM